MELKQDIIGATDKIAGVEDEDEDQVFHVLAVDDSLADRKIIEKLLRVSSYQVTCVDSGNKALEYLGLIEEEIGCTANSTSACACSCASSSSSSSPSPSPSQGVKGSKVNLIITDYSMPGMSGYDLLRKVKGSSWRDIPVVVMSSENVPSRINMCLEEGAKEFLLKPVQLSDLKKLQSHISKPVPTQNSPHLSEEEDEANGKRTVNKRKAVSLDSSERCRPKMEELSVL